jgi:hypothetical protein
LQFFMIVLGFSPVVWLGLKMSAAGRAEAEPRRRGQNPASIGVGDKAFPPDA